MGLEQVKIYSDSELVVNQVNRDYQAKGKNMAAYLKIIGEQLKGFTWLKIEQVPKAENVEADGLARIASGLEDSTLGHMSIDILSKPSTKESANHVMPVDNSPSWVNSIFEYRTKGKIPKNKSKARRIKYQAKRYMVINGKLYRRGYAMPYLRCLRPDGADEGNP